MLFVRNLYEYAVPSKHCKKLNTKRRNRGKLCKTKIIINKNLEQQRVLNGTMWIFCYNAQQLPALSKWTHLHVWSPSKHVWPFDQAQHHAKTHTNQYLVHTESRLRCIRNMHQESSLIDGCCWCYYVVI